MLKVLVRAVVEAIVFAGMSEEGIADSDAAVSHLEQIGAILQELSQADQKKFCSMTNEQAGLEEAAGASPARVEFLRSIPEHLGLTH